MPRHLFRDLGSALVPFDQMNDNRIILGFL